VGDRSAMTASAVKQVREIRYLLVMSNVRP
jgi:hypothetical protein